MNTVPILGRTQLEHVWISDKKILKNLLFQRLYLLIRQQSPWEATLVMDISRNHLAKDPDTLKDFSDYLESKNSLTEIVIFHKLAFSHLHALWLAQLGRQPNRLRIIYDKNQTFVEYDVKVIMQGKERVVIQVQ